MLNRMVPVRVASATGEYEMDQPPDGVSEETMPDADGPRAVETPLRARHPPEPLPNVDFRLDEELRRQRRLEHGFVGTIQARVERRAPRTGRLAALAVAITPRITLDELGTHAGSIAYGALFSLPPLMLLALSLVDTFVSRDDEVWTWVYEHLVDLVPGLESLLQLGTVSSAARVGFGLVGFLTLLWAATGLASRVRHALGIIHRTTVSGLTVGHAGGLVAQVPIGVGLLSLLAVSGALTMLANRGLIGPLVHTLGYVAIVALGMLFWTAAYWFLIPHRKQGFRELLPGGALYAVCFGLTERLGTWYYSYVSSRYSDLYGTIGTFLATLAIVYIMAWSLLLGAEVNQVLFERRSRARRDSAE